MKQILNTLIGFMIVLFIGLALYSFDIFPFNPGGPFIEEREEEITPEQTDPDQLPEFLAAEKESLTEDEKVTRSKSYSEYMNRAKALYDRGYHSLAIAEYESALEVSPANPSPLIRIGIIHFEDGDYIKAKINFEQALQINPDNLNANTYLGRSLIAERKFEEAKKIFDSIQIHNQLSKYYQALLTAYFSNHEKAKNLFYEVVNIGTDPEISTYAQNLISAYDEFNSNQGGMNIHLHTLLAKAYVNAGEYNLAIPLLFDVLKEKKNYRDAWIILGYAYLNQEKYQDAVDAFEEARKLDPVRPQTSFFLGVGYYGLNNPEKAVAYLELAKKNGYEPVIQVNQKLAEIYLKLQNYEKSAENFEEVVSLNDQDVYYYVKPIWIYIDKLKKPEKAVALANKTVSAHPGEAMSYNLLGWASISINRLDDAKTLLEKAHSIDPNLDAVYLNYGLLLEQKGDPKGALNYYNQAYNIGNGNSISEVAADRYNNIIGKMKEMDYSSLKADTLNQ